MAIPKPIKSAINAAKKQPNSMANLAFGMLSECIAASFDDNYDQFQRQKYAELAKDWYMHVLRAGKNTDQTALDELMAEMEAIQNRGSLADL